MILLSQFLFHLLWTCFINGASVESFHVHDLLERELREFSDVTSKKDDYEIVQFWHRNTTIDNKNGKELRFKRSGESVTWKLNEKSSFRWDTPVWLLQADDNLERVDEIIYDTIDFYQSSASNAFHKRSLRNTIVHTTDKRGNEYFVGRLGEKNLMPVSKRIARALRRDKPHLFKEKFQPGSVDQSGEFKLSHPHLIYTPGKPKNGNIKLVSKGQDEILRKLEKSSNRTSYKREKRSSADIIYPEILLIFAVDYYFPSVNNFRFLRLIMYIMNFWDTVALRFRSLRNPEVILRIAGVVVSKGVESFPLLKGSSNSLSRIHAYKVIEELPSWAKSRLSIPWDLVLIQTSAVIYDRDSGTVLGMANLQVSCSGMTQSGIFRDAMDYSGVTSAAHEIGHLLGARHDDATSPGNCSLSNYIMAQFLEFPHPFTWSSCSQLAISWHLRDGVGNCYDNDTPGDDQGELLDTMYLPGAKSSPKDQCSERGYAYACESPEICQNLLCHHTFWFCESSGPALDGTRCSLGECRNGECVSNNGVVTN